MRRLFVFSMWVVTFVLSGHAIATADAGPRVATYIGAKAYSGDSVQNWAKANSILDNGLQSDRVFYRTLPPSYSSDTNCSGLPAGVVCIVSFKTLNTNVVSYFKSVPDGHPVIGVFWHEPEGDFSSGSQYVGKFESQSRLIRSVHNHNVQVAMIAGGSQYMNPQRHGWDCSYIPPASYVNHYFMDLYDATDVGAMNIPSIHRWLHCTQGRHRSRGIAEMGIAPSKCSTSGMTRNQVLKSDLQWFPTVMPNMYLLEYWWSDSSGQTPSYCTDHWQFTDQTNIHTWIAAERGWLR